MTSMIAVQPIDPNTFEPSIRQAQMQEAALEGEKSDCLAQLAGAPNDEDLHELAVQLDREIASIKAKRERLVAAREEAVRRFTEANRHQFLRQLEQDRSEVAQLGAAMLEIASGIYANVVRLAPQIEQLRTLGAQRANLVWGIARAGSLTMQTREALRDLGTADRGALALLIQAAFRAAGVGEAGPTAGIEVPHPPHYPMHATKTRDWGSDNADHRAVAKEGFAEAEQQLAKGLKTAIDAVRGELRLPAIQGTPGPAKPPAGGDTKPADARAAVERKVNHLSGGLA